MTILLTFIHVVVCLFLIVVVLLQSGKAADLAGAFGGMGSQTVFGPRGSAYMRGPARLAADATIGRLAEKREATPTQIALAWLLARYDRMLLIPGTSSIAHLEENMAAIEISLDDDDLAALDHIAVASGAD